MDERNDEQLNGEDARRPYEAPAVVEEADFETLALSCGKVGTECYYDGPSAS